MTDQERKRLLIVEGRPTIVDFLCRVLRSCLGDGHQVESCGQAREALTRLQHQPFDLLIADLGVPDMNGLDLIRQTQQVSPQTRTLLITAYASPEIQDEAERLTTACLSKSFGISELVETVQHVLNGGVKKTGEITP